MNFREMLTQRLMENGLFENHATAVLAIAMADPEFFPEMKTRWMDDIGRYPAGMSNIIFAGIRPIAFKWITENIPKAWFRVVFAPGIDDLSGLELKTFIEDFHMKSSASVV